VEREKHLFINADVKGSLTVEILDENGKPLEGFTRKDCVPMKKMNKTKLPTHIEIDSEQCGLKNNSVVLAEQIRTIDKSRLKEKIGHIEDEKIINKINNALGVSFGLEE